MIEEDLDAGHPVLVVEGPDGPGTNLHLDPAAGPAQRAAQVYEHLVRRDLELLWVERLGLEGVRLHPRPEPPPAPHLTLAPRPHQDDVRMRHLDDPIEVAAVVGRV